MKLFAPVLVTGVSASKPTTKDLFLADGSGDINIGYAMTGDRVEPYQK